MRSPHTYTRWTQADAETLLADILGSRHPIAASPATGRVTLAGADMAPDEARLIGVRLIGVRLIEAAALADGPRAIRSQPQEAPHASQP